GDEYHLANYHGSGSKKYAKLTKWPSPGKENENKQANNNSGHAE
ncbi:unnamed protein product, partial [marine sediment metagenome]